MKFFKYSILVLLLSACGVVVNYDYDKEADFTKYQTYNYFNDIESGLSALDEKRFMRILDSTLQSKGFLFSEVPDFLIDIRSSEYENVNQNSVGVGVGGSGRNVGGGISIGIPVNSSKISRQITIDFVDRASNQLFWQAESDSRYNQNVSPEQREANLKTIIAKVLDAYPPK